MLSTHDKPAQAGTPMSRYRDECEAAGEVPCIDTRHHHWVYSDEDENVGYCDKCGCGEY